MIDIISKHKETIIFISFITIMAFIVIYFKIYDVIGVQSTITLFAVFVALGTGILTSFYNKNVLKQAKDLNEKTLDHARELNEKALLQSEKNLRIQLLFEESRKSLFELKKLSESRFNIKKLKEFMESSDAIYLPTNTRKLIENIVHDMDKYEENAPWNYPQPTKEQWEQMAREAEYEEQAITQSMNESEKYEYYYHEKVRTARSQIFNNVSNNLNKDPTEID